MNRNLSELLTAAKGAPIRFRDLDVTAMYELKLQHSTVVKVSIIEFSRQRPQALHVKAEGGSLTVNAISLRDAIFWTDTAPPAFEISFRPSRSSGVMKMWNEWRDERGTGHAWIGNAGIVVSSGENEFVLKCSDGVGEATFDDLVVRVQIVPREAPVASAAGRHRG